MRKPNKNCIKYTHTHPQKKKNYKTIQNFINVLWHKINKTKIVSEQNKNKYSICMRKLLSK